ncbi:guanine deaminase [Sphingomonas fennica]|uniref:Guanine deaminase n=1 Tax=Edaphosphingomonas fennica TaxID=114404 RepID=A0A2T4HLJ1_9SPHN|nr:guanine deaminase [Sphingomonas fennica]PTD16665.1 guanine deaminase [Sphingomonas fennica]
MTSPRSNPATVLRGPMVYLVDDPFLTDPASAFVHEPDGVVICRDGLIEAAGPYDALRDGIPADAAIHHYPDGLICPGFIDTHVHYVQTGIIGAFGRQLLDWLNEYTFVAEQAFADPAYAATVAGIFCEELLRNGTTSALVFAAVYPQSVDALFEEAGRRNMRLIAGKVMMDRNAPAALLDTAQSAYDNSLALLERWHGRDRLLYAITPRFAATSTPAQLEAAGALWRAHPDAFVHTHISENMGEIDWVRRLFPERAGYLDIYDHYGLVGRRTMLAHGVHLTEAEFGCCHERGAAIAHCPTSNLFLGSGLFRIDAAKDPARPVHVGLGSDIGAGTSFSLLATAGEAYKVAQLNGFALDAVRALFLATLGGARALGLDDRIGTIRAGHEADLVVLDPRATPLLAFRTERARSIEEILFVLMTLGDDRAVRATYVAGRIAHARDGA